MTRDALKRMAAKAAVAMVRPGMLVGLGTGSTANHAIDLLAEQGTRFTGVPTSAATARRARALGIKLLDGPMGEPIDLTIDGADEIAAGDLSLIKGMGGALFREKIVAAASRAMIVIADDTKLVPRLSGTLAVPVEVLAFGVEATQRRIAALGCRTTVKQSAFGGRFYTDSGNVILLCQFDALPDAAAADRALSDIVGVVETGFFIGLATTALVASADGVRRIDRARVIAAAAGV